ncbi:PQQ-dependent sugar dehydrogenase [Deinococcus peraridilitoris]|uniref:Glucose/sorbosone dehydrogenase n=1 Tax=Deinococcus peraridilitoris (strain DSM 19664 / LMG 22246 / CIP 109416 / KR-200) TaxID=937777 RepID=L0A2Y0_DEIPD|nr:PQQ-dependent sugar dehydrogenase [Deinococcus peraridilitoris]AFZ68243.1 glucose/sorbosone dehydrogenase [Deinococcus peraridilitoris DSM 19664]
MKKTTLPLRQKRIRHYLGALLLPAVLLACGQPNAGGVSPSPGNPSTQKPSPTSPPPQSPPSNSPIPNDPPSGGKFEDRRVAQLYAPTDLAFAPDGRMLITSQSGKVRVYHNGSLLPTPALDLAGSLCTNYERGLLGITLDPQFASNQFVYTYYTSNKNGNCDQNTPNGPVNRVSRFTMNGNSIDRASEKVLLDNIPAFGGNHNGGDLAFGPDGLLYISVGDAFCVMGNYSRCGGDNSNSRSRANLLGKILRIEKNGNVPASNPWSSETGARFCGNPAGVPAGTGPCAETFAWGLRNPFRMAFKPGTGDLYINDVGQEAWEEINLGKAGADYGWNTREGNCKRNSVTDCGAPPAGMTNPIFAYDHADNCKSITGGVFVPRGVWPKEYDNVYLFADYVCGKIFRLLPQGDGSFARADFRTNLGESSAVTLMFGPYNDTQALYYLTYAGGGEVRRISYVFNRAPQASATASVTSGTLPLEITFDAGQSSDPDGDPLRFRWDFGDGSAPASGAKVTHTYTKAGTFTARVTVTDNQGATGEATLQVQAGNTAPKVQILSPTTSDTFRVGQTLTLRGSASDAEDGALADAQLTWHVELRHNDDHSHPFLTSPGNNLTITAPAPEGLDATERSYVLITLTATDSRGASTTVTQKLQPRRVNVSFDTRPAGLTFDVNGTAITGAQTRVSWEGYVLNLTAPVRQTQNGTTYQFQGWSNGGANPQSVTTPATGGSFTAIYR